jgi:hypothetical protein
MRASTLSPKTFVNDVTRGGIEPTGQNGMPKELRSPPSEMNKHLLDDLLRDVGTTRGTANSSLINEIQVTTDQLVEIILRVIEGKATEEIGIFAHSWAHTL